MLVVLFFFVFSFLFFLRGRGAIATVNVGNVFTYKVIDFYSHLRRAFVKWRFSLKGV